jgi:hypothetical protein
MRFICERATGVLIAGVLSAAACMFGQQDTPAKFEGIPARATPADYMSHAQGGNLTLAAELTGHSVALPEGTLESEDYIVIETALYGPPGTQINLSHENFELRLNGKKTLLASAPYGLVVKTLKDPEMEPPASEKSKTSLNTGGGGQGGSNDPPAPVKVPVELRHQWEQHLQKASLAEGNRALPQAGLIYFPHRGKTEKLQSIELIYTGPTGQITLALQP